eukprot:gene1244-1569_t
MDSEAVKNHRKKELEEMKKRIAEYKEKNKTAATKSTTATKPTSPTTSSPTSTTTATGGSPTATTSPNPTKGMDFDSFLDSIHQMVPSPTPEQQQQQPQQESPKLESVKKPTLSIQSLVIEVDFPPKETPMYSKATQTVEIDASDDSDLSSSNSNVNTSTPIKNKLKYQLQQQQQQQHQQSQSTGTATLTDQFIESSSDASIAKEEEPVIPELNEYEKQEIIDSDAFKSFFTRSSRIIERALCLDDSIDILVDYTQSDDSNSKSSSKELKLIGTLSDERWTKHRSVTDINWSPKHPDLVVTSYSANEAGSHDPDGVVLVWSVNNYFQKPEYVFNCQSPVMTTFFSKYHPTLIVGGTYSGQIVIWDTRAKSTPVQRTPLSSVGHTHPVYSMSVIGSTNANSLVSISTDARLCTWNIENLSQPTETMDLNVKNAQPAGLTQGSAIAVTSLVFPDNELNAFYIGTEEGMIYQAFRHGSKAGVSEKYRGHYGPITSVDFHPPSKGNSDFSHLFLSSSTDWTCKLWSTKNEAPVHSFEDFVDYVYDARWSPVHPSVFATGDGSGHLSLWDLNQDIEAPIFRSKVSQRSVNRLSWAQDGKRLLVGDSGGSLSLFDSSEFATPHVDSWINFEDVLTKIITKPLSLQQDSPLLGHKNLDDTME